jgi:hypothetical protein
VSDEFVAGTGDSSSNDENSNRRATIGRGESETLSWFGSSHISAGSVAA